MSLNTQQIAIQNYKKLKLKNKKINENKHSPSK